MKPWEKRLRDLSRLLQNCHATYLDPDLFRMNTNQFLQTARTVTFIIQKNKSTIPDYEKWYSNTVVKAWGRDDVMSWAKEARNTIEKEGDLELNSSLKLTLVFSYLVEDDVEIQCGKKELLNAGVNKLVHLAEQNLPSGVSDAAVVKIERRWVTAMLPNWELLQALAYVYARIFGCCKSLAKQLGTPLEECIPDAHFFRALQDEARQVSYIKLNGLSRHSLKTKAISVDRKFRPPPAIQEAFNSIHANRSWPRNPDGVLEYYTNMAELMFIHFGSHVPMLFLFNECWELIDIVSTQFEDQADKFIFWRDVADRIVTLQASGLVWISESWIRSMDRSGVTAVRNMPITGEQLHVVAVEKSGNIRQIGWYILRDSDAAKPVLQRVPVEDKMEKDALPYFLVPALRAMGIKDPEFMTRLHTGKLISPLGL
ncbi:MAG TPA: hypothetical protein VIM85_05980 [Pseudomonadales bacterium]